MFTWCWSRLFRVNKTLNNLLNIQSLCNNVRFNELEGRILPKFEIKRLLLSLSKSIDDHMLISIPKC